MTTIYHDVEQRSPEWYELKRGIPSASSFSEMITPGGKRSSSFERYLNTLVAERLVTAPEERFESAFMRRGIALEPEALGWYEFEKDVDVGRTGFVHLEGVGGCSPDGLLDKGGLEIKCPAPHTHVAYLKKGILPSEYIAQVQGSIFICERDFWDFLSYHPEIPKLLIRCYRDEVFIAKLVQLLIELNDAVESTTAKLEKLRRRG